MKVDRAMNHRDLLNKLIQIERAIGIQDNLTVQNMLMDAEQCLLDLEKERVQTMRREADLSALSGFQNEPSSFALRAEARNAVRTADEALATKST